MAIAVTVTIRDGKGKRATTRVHIPSSTDVADMIEFAQEFGQVLANTMTGTVERIGACLDIPVNFSSLAAPDSDVEEGAQLQFQTAGGYHTGFRIPTFDEGKILANSDVVDQTDGAVTALVNLMVGGFTTTSTQLVLPCDSREDDIVQLTSAIEAFKKYG